MRAGRWAAEVSQPSLAVGVVSEVAWTKLLCFGRKILEKQAGRQAGWLRAAAGRGRRAAEVSQPSLAVGVLREVSCLKSGRSKWALTLGS
jgi:hypothetical protein